MLLDQDLTFKAQQGKWGRDGKGLESFVNVQNRTTTGRSPSLKSRCTYMVKGVRLRRKSFRDYGSVLMASRRGF